MVVKHVVYHRSVNLPHFPTLANDRLEYNNKDPPAQRRLGGEEGKKEGVLHTYISTYYVHTGSKDRTMLYVPTLAHAKKQVTWKEGPFL